MNRPNFLTSLRSFAFLLSFGFALWSLSEVGLANESVKAPAFTRVGGNYKINKIEKTKTGTFLVVFEAMEKSGKADLIRLEANHIQMGLSHGQVLRISAELLENQKVDSEVVDAYQVLLFIPKREGEMPVWMLSKHEKGGRGDLNGARYLEMHAPQNDYLIL